VVPGMCGITVKGERAEKARGGLVFREIRWGRKNEDRREKRDLVSGKAGAGGRGGWGATDTPSVSQQTVSNLLHTHTHTHAGRK
jgi:hypothetical protein